MYSEIESAAIAGDIPEPDAITCKRGVTYFTSQLKSAVAKVCELQKTHKAAREEYALYMKQTNRNADELKTKMRRVKDWNTPLAEAIKLETDITLKIDENIKKLTLQPYHSVCAKVVGLPRELRNQIYGHVYRALYINIDWPDPHSVMGMPMLRGWARKTPGSFPIDTAELWIGDVLA
ncbi:hypothetical protein HBH56_098900 [Parastagonospora nodorum]|uniref:Uncharacterized protein n=1 Tax=Phaeosphaeria nodorum (strain SN15 / ATCC MYA-4574 / FGSC 10173) TaxID=321614 RepID=A0A7U2NR65_PHANO|nr:hypothetical protein HBH56_098900 [Parastagonospora nodorum]QRD07409.1 hypothetical protein JI435_447410 [Parastagonospora nodorum SN15]KAH3930217.1 hypothetical protein HBH54_113220 [Parastagonospora nodorum]KAH4136160.1 hypothetical protein HBH45_137960 [Parastagonospora nodorum]KAH4158120.1 hypothetical protein HBH44_116940 [Parastagonospora nodorum]